MMLYAILSLTWIGSSLWQGTWATGTVLSDEMAWQTNVTGEKEIHDSGVRDAASTIGDQGSKPKIPDDVDVISKCIETNSDFTA